MATGYYVNNPGAQAAYLAGAKSAGSSGVSSVPSNTAALQLAKATSANTGLGSTAVNAAQGLASASAPSPFSGSNNAPAQQLASASQGSVFGGSNNAPSGDSGIRTTLNQMGFPNQDIGWNQSNGQVSLSGPGLQTQYIQPDANANGTTYASPADIQGAATATGWTDQEEKQINDMINSITQSLNNPFSFNPSSSPQYQAALNAANSDMNAADNATQEKLGTLGMSTVGAQALQGQNAQIYNDEVANLLPSMESQAYNEYQGNLSDKQNALSQLSGLQNTGVQQQLAQAAQAMNQNHLNAEDNYDYGRINAQQQEDLLKAVQLSGVVSTQAQSQATGMPIGTTTAQLQEANARNGIAQQNANNGSQNSNTTQEHDMGAQADSIAQILMTNDNTLSYQDAYQEALSIIQGTY